MDGLEDLRREWGVRLRAARLRAGLRQDDLSERSGVDQGYISQIELGRVGLSDKTKLRLAAALDSAVAELFPYPEPGRGRVA